MTDQLTNYRYQDRDYLVQDQYKDAGNLSARAQLHRLFSVSPVQWSTWLFDHFHLQPGESVLECGCGPGGLWAANLDRLPTNCHFTLTDLSPGMVETAQANLDGRPYFRFQVADIQELPFEDASFDVVVANHMLYHVPDLAKGLSEVRRVLKPGGRFFAATNGRNHMRELYEMGGALFPELQIYKEERVEVQDHAFRLENGEAKLKSYFTDVTLHRFDDRLKVTEVRPLLDYILSSSEIRAAVTDDILRKATAFFEAAIASQGSITVTKDSGLFSARRP